MRNGGLIGATLFTLFHVLVVVGDLIATGGSGEGQAFTVLIFDFPLALALHVIPGGGYILYSSTTAYILFFAIVGTAMYALLGWWIGRFVSKLVTVKRSSVP